MKWEKLKAALKTNRSVHKKGSGDLYWNSVIEVIKAHVEAATPAKAVKAASLIITDGCMWEMNHRNGTAHDHAIEVVNEDNP